MTDQVTCAICLGILYRPAVLPCKHVFCKECILSAVEKTAYQCPICRFRLSNWLRKIKDLKDIINEDHENQLRLMFPDYYRIKETGASPMLSKTEQRCLKDLTNSGQWNVSSSNGELFSEYLKEVEKFRRVRAAEEQKNEEASLALAFQLLEEDRLLLSEDQSVFDSAVSRNGPLPSCSPVHFLPPSRTTPKVSKPSKTLLDYSVDIHHASSTSRATTSNLPSENQIAQDEAFARRLQSRYSQPLRSPPNTRSKRRFLRSMRR